MIYPMRNLSRICYTVACGLITAAAAMPGHAQNSLALEEVIVTAEKRSASLQDTPISVAAFEEQELEAIGVFEAGQISENCHEQWSQQSRADAFVPGSVACGCRAWSGGSLYGWSRSKNVVIQHSVVEVRLLHRG